MSVEQPSFNFDSYQSARDRTSFTGWGGLPAISRDPALQAMFNERINFPARPPQAPELTDQEHQRPPVVEAAEQIVRREWRYERWAKTALNIGGFWCLEAAGNGASLPNESAGDTRATSDPTPPSISGHEEITDALPVTNVAAWRWELEQRVHEQRAQPPGPEPLL